LTLKTRVAWSALPPANLTYFCPKVGNKKKKCSGLIKDETWGFGQRHESYPLFVPRVSLFPGGRHHKFLSFGYRSNTLKSAPTL
jgi:hypothetical protein